MARKKDGNYIRDIPLSNSDFKAFERLREALENMSSAKLAAILLHHAIWNPEQAISARLREALIANSEEQKAQNERSR